MGKAWRQGERDGWCNGMMEDLAMLRPLIGQVPEFLDVYGSPPTVPPNYFLQFRPQSTLEPHPRWCFHDPDSSVDYGCYNLKMTACKYENLKMLERGKPPPVKRARKQSHEKNLIASASSTQDMDPRVWKELPEDLFEAVIARLPISTFFRLRSVCRKWNSLLNSPSFCQQCNQVEQRKPWFYVFTHDNGISGSMYDPSLKKWLYPTFPALPTTKFIWLPVASAGGLICFLDVRHMRFCVCNPLTNSFKQLPASSVNIQSRLAVGMTLNMKSNGSNYKILWLNNKGEYEVYDSRNNSWTNQELVASNIKLPLTINFNFQSVSINGTLYFMRCDPDGIVSYNMTSRVWKEYLIPAPQNINDQTLAECGGRIILVGLVTKNAATCVCIWELQKMTLLWKEVDRMPNIWCLDFYGKHVRMICLGNKGMLMLSLRTRQMHRIFTYDLSAGEWVKLWGCGMPQRRRRRWAACGAAFYPSLTASA